MPRVRRRRLLVCDDCQCYVFLAQQPDGTAILVGGGGKIHAAGHAAEIWGRG